MKKPILLLALTLYSFFFPEPAEIEEVSRDEEASEITLLIDQ